MKPALPKTLLDPIVNFLNARAPRERLFMVGFAAALVLALDFLFWLQPVSSAISATWPKLATRQAELDELRTDKKDEALIQKKWEEIQKQLQDNESRIGASSQISAVLESLSKLASESGIRITSLKPVENVSPAANKLYYAVPIQLTATAGTHELGRFLMRLETADTFYKITDLKITANPSNEKKHLVELMLETYKKT